MHPYFTSLLKQLFLFILLSFSIIHQSAAQKYLSAYKSNGKNLRYYQGNEINVRLKEEDFFRNGIIAAFTDTSFFLNGEYIPLSEVDAILIRKEDGGHSLLRSMSYMLPIGGVFIIGVTALNSAINDHQPLVPEKIFYLAGGMALTGLLIYPLTFRVYHMKRHPLKIIDISFSTN
jgi:hypothetical protein